MGGMGRASLWAATRQPSARRAPRGPAAAAPPIICESRPVLPRDTQVVTTVALGSGVGP
jgi:hypothetical protein